MLKYRSLEHVFTDQFPERLKPGLLYVSLEYGSVAHSCCCGCGEEVVTPLTPTDWHIIYDGEAISLHPSVGSWTLPCRSHYVIRRGEVLEAGPWTERQISAERARDRQAKAAFYAREGSAEPITPVSFEPQQDNRGKPPSLNWLEKIWRWFSH